MSALAFLLAAALPAESPKSFVQRTYADYRHSNYSSLAHAPTIFTPELVAPINEDQRNARGEVGFIDGDPLCDCQDSAGMHARLITIGAKARSASARLIVSFRGSKEVRAIRLTMVQTRAGWRIADVATHGQPSLLRALQASNRSSRRR